jgi:hypothetical protein
VVYASVSARPHPNVSLTKTSSARIEQVDVGRDKFEGNLEWRVQGLDVRGIERR